VGNSQGRERECGWDCFGEVKVVAGEEGLEGYGGGESYRHG